MKKISKSIFIFLLLATTFVACKDEGFTMLEKGKGDTIKPGDMVFFTLTILGDMDTLLVNNNESMLPTIKIPTDAKSVTGNVTEDMIIKIISKRKVGDSILVSIPVDSFPGENPALAGKKMINYHIRIKNSMDSLSYKSYVDKQMLDMQAKASERAAVDTKPIQEHIEKVIASFKENKLKIETTPSGLKYTIHELGKGKLPKAGQTVVVDYYGCLMDGTNFDKSFGKQTPFQFPVGKGNVIAGWDEAFQILPIGTKATIFIPSSLGYGPQGAGASIPPNADLAFYVELQEVQ